MKERTDIVLSIGFVFGLTVVGAGSLGTLDTGWQSESALKGTLQRKIEDDLTTRLPLREAAISFWTAAKLALLGQVGAEIVVGDGGWLFTTEEMRAPEAPDFVFEVRSVQQRLAEAGISLVPVLVPDKSRIYEDKLPRERSEPFRKRYGAALGELRRLGLPAHELHRVLQDGRTSADTYMRTDTHWSPHGAELVARTIANALPIAGEPDAFSTTRNGDAAFAGDLIPFVDTGMFRGLAAIPSETVKAAETRRNGGTDMLLADTETPLALVGTSFSARSEFNFAGFLQQESGLGLVDYSSEGKGPFVPMREILQSGEIFRTGAKVVIWEIPERYIDPRELR